MLLSDSLHHHIVALFEASAMKEVLILRILPPECSDNNVEVLSSKIKLWYTKFILDKLSKLKMRWSNFTQQFHNNLSQSLLMCWKKNMKQKEKCENVRSLLLHGFMLRTSPQQLQSKTPNTRLYSRCVLQLKWLWSQFFLSRSYE